MLQALDFARQVDPLLNPFPALVSPGFEFGLFFLQLLETVHRLPVWSRRRPFRSYRLQGFLELHKAEADGKLLITRLSQIRNAVAQCFTISEIGGFGFA